MASAAGQQYYCHQCLRTVRPASSADLVCPDCNGGFLEEWSGSVTDAPSSAGANFPPWNSRGPDFGAGSEEGPGAFHAFQGMRGMPGNTPALAQLLETMSTFFLQMQTAQIAQDLGQDAEGEGAGRIRLGMDVGGVNPMLLLRGQMQNILGGGGNVELFIDNGTEGGPRRLPGNIGDYFFGPGLEQLIQQLAENDPNRHGAPPASKSAVEQLPTIYISEEQLGTEAAQCAVCKDEFELCSEVKQMPCKHMYHPDCILPWLEQHNSCPVCRYELPTDDPDYEQTRARGPGAPASSGIASPEGAQGEGQRGSGGFSIWGIPSMGGRFPARTDGRVDTTEQQNTPGSAGTSGPPQGGNAGGSGGGGIGTGRRFSIPFPWFRGTTTTSQSPANAQAESSSQANSAETVSSGPVGEGNDTPGQTSRAPRTDDDGDTLMSERRQGGPE